MKENFRQFLGRLRQAGELVDLHQAVDIRHIATLVDQAKTALFFHKVIGYDMPVVSGIIRSKERAIMSMGCENFGEIEHKVAQAIAKPIPPRRVNGSPTREVTLMGDDVDLYKLPIPMSSIYDGGPMITAGVVIARDPELGMNSGIYRFIVKEKALTGIDIVTPNNMRLFAQRAFERKEPLPISISIGTHPFEITGSGYRAPLGVDEMAIAGGLRGEAVDLAPCSTIDMPYIADAEIVLEAEILPTGWTWPEGRFGEFTRLMGGLHWNPLVRIKAISMRKDAIYYNLHMPWENTWLAAPTRYAAIRQALRTANVQVKDINVTLGGCAFWHAVISIKKGAGEGKNALLAALSVMDLKHVVVVDEDIDVNDPTDVEWAIATRVQGDKDVIVIPGARAKPLDPSLLQGAGVVPLGAKVGIDATIPEHIPLEHYERITYAYADTAEVDDYVKGKKDKVGQTGDDAAMAKLAADILAAIEKEPLLLRRTSLSGSPTYDFRTVARALGHLHETERLWQDPRGKMCVRGCEVRGGAAGQEVAVAVLMRYVLRQSRCVPSPLRGRVRVGGGGKCRSLSYPPPQPSPDKRAFTPVFDGLWGEGAGRCTPLDRAPHTIRSQDADRHHTHVIATDTKKYPLAPLFGRQSAWSAEHPLDYPDMIKAIDAAGVDKAILVQASSAYAFDNTYVSEAVAAYPDRFTGVFSIDVIAPDAVAKMTHWMGKGLTGMRIFTAGSTQPEAADVLCRGSRLPRLAIRRRQRLVGLHADAAQGRGAAGHGDGSLPEGPRHPRPFRPCRGRGRPALRPRRRRCSRSRNIRTSISS